MKIKTFKTNRNRFDLELSHSEFEVLSTFIRLFDEQFELFAVSDSEKESVDSILCALRFHSLYQSRLTSSQNENND